MTCSSAQLGLVAEVRRCTRLPEVLADVAQDLLRFDEARPRELATDEGD
jgi:hypothetical protein